ncbi:hypothetical protein SDC9_138256 [bioreactor metagenome]|uniref:Uncharacterized protein n=1 Tax=bioreactor metagenome TaxID=1076179 RepID=A0A645DNT7_9ZZZZ
MKFRYLRKLEPFFKRKLLRAGGRPQVMRGKYLKGRLARHAAAAVARRPVVHKGLAALCEGAREQPAPGPVVGQLPVSLYFYFDKRRVHARLRIESRRRDLPDDLRAAHSLDGYSQRRALAVAGGRGDALRRFQLHHQQHVIGLIRDQLFEEGPHQRRRYMVWQVRDDFCRHLRQFAHVIEPHRIAPEAAVPPVVRGDPLNAVAQPVVDFDGIKRRQRRRQQTARKDAVAGAYLKHDVAGRRLRPF